MMALGWWISVFCLVGVLVSDCIASPVQTDQNVAEGLTTGQSNPDGLRKVDGLDGTLDIGDNQRLKKVLSKLADLEERVLTLTHALTSAATSHGRSPRSTTVGTFSEYFGSLNAGAYGNCTCRGDPGPTGPQGIPGRDGRDGRDAPPPCRDNENGPTTHTTSTTGNGVYIRWGRTICRDGSQLVYEGVIGGPRYTYSGGGSNYMCLPLDPIYDQVTAGVQGSRAYVYGAEMEIAAMDPEWNSLHNNGPRCAVCVATQRPTVLMIPARNVCPSNWTLEYKGQLMAEYHGYHRTEHICLDRHPELTPGTSSINADGVLLHPVEARCTNGNSLPCGPYVNGNELSCAVCSL